MRKSILLAKLEALDNRLIKPSKEVKEELRKCRAGLEGEKRVLYFLAEINETARVLHDIRLPFPNGFTYFQVDIMIVTRSTLIILDAKHFSGHLIFNRRTKQLIRDQQTFTDPIIQVLRHKRGLEQWLDQSIPIVPAVVLTHPNVCVEIIPEDSPDHTYILYAPELPAKMDEFLDGKKSILTIRQLHALAAKLQNHHHPYDPNILAQFAIQPSSLQTGIQCAACQKWSVKKTNRRWCCHSCGAVLKNAHLMAMKEYVRLFGTRATNKQMREFMGIESDSIVRKMLVKWSVGYEGTTRDRLYLLPNEWKWS